MSTTAEDAVHSMLDPEQFRVGAPPLVPTGLDDVGVLKAHIARLEAQQQSKPGVLRGESADAKVTAPVTPKRKPGRPRGSTNQRKEIFMTPSTTPTPTPGSNAPSFENHLAAAIQLGEEAGKGVDTQIKFDLNVLEGGYLGALSNDPNKHGKGRRDAMILAEAYVKARQGNVIFDARADKSRKLISNLDKMIRLGSTPKWGVGQPMQNVNELITARQKLKKDPAMSKRLDDAHNMLMRYATAQLKSDTLIDGAQRDQFAFKKDPEERTVEEVLEGIRKTAIKLAAGKIPHCNGLDNSNEVQSIIDKVTKRLKAIATARGQNP